MAMPSGKAAVTDGMQFVKGTGAGAGGGGGEVRAPPWMLDERDGFIAWLLSEFAAANAIIDLMSDHLRGVGEPGEYGYVIGAIHRRRGNWSPVLHMQPYFPIGEVSYALQQVMRRKQRQRRYHDHPRRFSDKGFRKTGYKQAHSGGNLSELRAYDDEGRDRVEPFDEDSSIPTVGKQGADSALDDAEVDIAKKVGAEVGGMEAKQEDGDVLQDCKVAGENAEFNNALTDSEEGEVQSSSPLPKQFKVHEMVDGKLVNVVEGLKLYENLFDSSEISKLFFLANELRAAGRRGEFPGSTFFVSKRPMRGHGRETLQFCPSVADWSSEVGDTARVYVKEHTLDKIPGLFQDVINRLVQLRIMSVKPDSCILNFYHEGDHSHPYMFPSRYGRPVCVFSLNECDMVFGRVFEIDYPGNFKSSLKLSLTAGSIIVVQGKSAELSKHAISSLRKQRVLVTFTKYCAKISASTDDSHLPVAHQMAGAAPLPWGSGLSYRSNHGRYLLHPQHVGAIPTCVVLSASQSHAHFSPSNSEQPHFTAAPVTSVVSAMSFPAPAPLVATVTWQPVLPQPNRLVPGTGVFLPPGSGQLESAQLSVGDTNSTMEASGQSESTSWSGTTENGARASSIASSEDAVEGRSQNPDCNGHIFTKEEPVDSRARFEGS